MIYFLVIFIFYWAYSIAKSILNLNEVIKLHDQFAEAFELYDKENDTKHLRTLIRRKPVLSEHLDYFYLVDLSYNSDDYVLREVTPNIFCKLLELIDRYEYNLKKNFNPFYTARNFFQIPANFFSYLGLKIKQPIKKLLNIGVWIIIFLLNLFSDDIKKLIQIALKKLIS